MEQYFAHCNTIVLARYLYPKPNDDATLCYITHTFSHILVHPETDGLAYFILTALKQFPPSSDRKLRQIK